VGETKSEAQTSAGNSEESKSTGSRRQTLEDNIKNRLNREWMKWLKIRSTGEIFGRGNVIGVTYMLLFVDNLSVCQHLCYICVTYKY
jgi:hypothetical protein